MHSLLLNVCFKYQYDVTDTFILVGPMLVIFINDIESAMEVLVKRGTDFANKFRTTSSNFVLQLS